METLLWKGRARIYFNAFEEAPLVWSVDDGDTASEVKTVSVIFHHTGVTVTGDRTIQPKCWIEFIDVEVWKIGWTVMIRKIQ